MFEFGGEKLLVFAVIFLGGYAAYVEFVASGGEFDLFGAFGAAGALFVA